MSATTSTYDGQYRGSWEEFIRDIGKLHKKRKLAMRGEATTAGTPSIILSGQRTYVRAASMGDARKRIERAHAQQAEIARLTTRTPNATRYAVDTQALAALGAPRLTTRTAQQRQADRNTARAFWVNCATDRRRAQVAAEPTTSHQLWRVMNAPEEPTTEAEHNAWAQLRASVKRLAAPAPAPRMAVNPAGMTPERALEIAIAALAPRTPAREISVR